MERDRLFEAPITRRSLLRGAALAAGALALPLPATAGRWEKPRMLNSALRESPLVYVSPLKSDGAESTCHGEVWFVEDDYDILVVTASDRWKAAAIGKGLDKARLWVGDYGVWTRSGGKFKQAPAFSARAVIDKNAAVHRKALKSFGAKYPAEWGKWGPRFENGLADESRVLIRYMPTGP